MSVKARSRILAPKYAFLVQDWSGGFTTSRFQQCTGLEVAFAIAEYAEGGAIAPMKEATRASFSNFTLSRGIDVVTDFWDWCMELCRMLGNLPTGRGVASPDQLRDFGIYQLQRDRSVLKTVPCYNCQPARFKPIDSDNMSDDIQIEELEVAYEFFDVVVAT